MTITNMADKKEANVDLFRDTWVRYLGYANEIGESFKYHIPRIGYFGSYVVASSYALADASTKSLAMYQTKQNVPQDLRMRSCAEAFLEAVVWQGLASVAIPGFTINRICFVMSIILRRFASNLTPVSRSWITTAAGLAAIPIIIHPIDRSVDYVMARAIQLSGQLGVKHNINHSDGWSFPGPNSHLLEQDDQPIHMDLS